LSRSSIAAFIARRFLTRSSLLRKSGWLRSSGAPIASSLAGDAHEPAHRLGDEIEGRATAIRSAAAKPGNIAVDEVGIERPEPRLVETHVYENAAAEILDQDIAAGDQLGEHLAALFVPQVEGQRTLVAVEAGEVPAEPITDDTLSAHRIALAGGLDLDHLGSHVAEDHRAERPGEDAGQIDHAQSR
jgi:hypothetical protein